VNARGLTRPRFFVSSDADMLAIRERRENSWKELARLSAS
jgi:hypothetical protein